MIKKICLIFILIFLTISVKADEIKYSYKIEYYFDNVLNEKLTETIEVVDFKIIDTYPSKIKIGYVLEKEENFPLEINENSDNTIKVFYVKETNNKINLKVNNSGLTSIKISWNKNDSDGYIIYRSTNKKKWKKIATTTKTTYTNKKLKKNKTYYYKVKSYKIANNKKIFNQTSYTIKTKTIKLSKKEKKALNDVNSLLKTNKYSKSELRSKLKYSKKIEEKVIKLANINFKNNALYNALIYSNVFNLSESELRTQLKEYDKFTNNEINYALSKCINYGSELSSNKIKIKKDLYILGYSLDEVNKIYELFNENDIKKYLLNKKYNNIFRFKSSKYFNLSKINRYEEYYKKYNYDIDRTIIYVEIGLDKKFYTNTKAAKVSDGKLILVNKYNYLKKNYNANLEKLGSKYGVGSLNKEAASYFRKMVNEAKNDGINLRSVSAYRSYSTQKYLYNSYAKRDGKAKADTYSARAGHSEHQTGLAVDINTASSSSHFENTKEYKWLQDNSYKFGFVMRYPNGKQNITGYKYEPWHYRYFGVDVATALKESNLTYEEYLVINK